MKSFARAARLPNISGRGDYIANPERQECIVAASAKVDWKPYHDYEMANQKTKLRNNEGREVIVALPNEWAEQPQAELHRKGDALAQTVAGKGRDVQWAMHWNKDHTNFHIHIIFSERQKEKNPGRWDRDVYLTDDGKVARRKADRARAPDGSIKPPVHRKGEVKEPFTAKDPKFATKKWLHEVKAEIRSTLEEMGAKFEKPKLLHEFHEGKGSEAPLIRQKNEVIRENNARLEALASRGMDAGKYSKVLIDLLKQGKVPVLYLDQGRLRTTYFTTPALAVELMKKTMGQILPAPPVHVQQPEKPAPAEPVRKPEKAAPAEPVQQPQKAAPAAREPEPERERPAAQKPSQKLRAAFSDLQAAQAKVSSARYELSKADALPFWNKTKKPKKEAANRELYAARQECQDAFDRVVSFGVSTYRDGVQLSGSNLDRDDMNYLERRVDWRINEMERSEAHAAKPSLAENISEAMKRYREHQKEIAPAVEARMNERAKSQSKGGPER